MSVSVEKDHKTGGRWQVSQAEAQSSSFSVLTEREALSTSAQEAMHSVVTFKKTLEIVYYSNPNVKSSFTPIYPSFK